jgi:hypothetical protein
VAHAKGELKVEEYEVGLPAHVESDTEHPRTPLVGRARPTKSAGKSVVGAEHARPNLFARQLVSSLRAVQDWTEGRRKPETDARAYLLVVARESKAVGWGVERRGRCDSEASALAAPQESVTTGRHYRVTGAFATIIFSISVASRTRSDLFVTRYPSRSTDAIEALRPLVRSSSE